MIKKVGKFFFFFLLSTCLHVSESEPASGVSLADRRSAGFSRHQPRDLNEAIFSNEGAFFLEFIVDDNLKSQLNCFILVTYEYCWEKWPVKIWPSRRRRRMYCSDPQDQGAMRGE